MSAKSEKGAKTALLAGMLDERATIVHPNATCPGGCGGYRTFMKAVAEDGNEYPSEYNKEIFVV